MTVATLTTATKEDEVPSSQRRTTTTTTTTTTSSSRVLADDDDFTKPIRDFRKYRAIQLSNGLQVLLVSSPTSDVEAAAMHIKVGHFHDTLPGMAHLHEHMVFLGTQKYPSPKEFESYLGRYGGSSNAYTDMEDTNYYLDVTPPSSTSGSSSDNSSNNNDDNDSVVSNALYGALDRMAQLFISPTFDSAMVEREVRAIDSEYRNALTSDSWRLYQLLKHCAHSSHPFAKFGCGNVQTLQTSQSSSSSSSSEMSFSATLTTELRHFWNQYYRTNNMRLCVASRASLDELQHCVEEIFGSGLLMPSSTDDEYSATTLTRTRDADEDEDHHNDMVIRAFDSHNLGRIVETIPLLEGHSIKLYFAIPPLDSSPEVKESRPYRVVSHVLGHESPGSLHNVLNSNGWLVGLTTGIGIDCSDFALFTLTLNLTPTGMQPCHLNDVLDLVFEWIHLVKQQTTTKVNDNDDDITDTTPMEAYHDELKQMSNITFQFRENGDVTDFCSSAAELLFEYDASNVLVGPSVTGNYNTTTTREFMGYLRPDNALIMICNSNLTSIDDDDDDDDGGDGEWKTEPWYKAQYRDRKMTLEELKRWSNPPKIDPQLHLPALNKYIPTDFTLKCDIDDKCGNDVETSSSPSSSDEGKDDMKSWFRPPKLIVQDHPNLRMWHKLDRHWRVPKTYIRLSLLSPNVYRSPRTMTLNRIYQRLLNDDLNSLVYDASIAGLTYSVSCVPSGYRITVSGYSEKLFVLLETLLMRMVSLLEEMTMQQQDDNDALQRKFEKAKANLWRETKNYRLDSPHEVASYNSRLLMEEKVWYLNNYIDELESSDPPLTMHECAHVAQDCLLGRVKAEAFCIGNIDEGQARQVADIVDKVFLQKSRRPLLDVEMPVFRSVKLPTRQEAKTIIASMSGSSDGSVNGSDDDDHCAIPLVCQEVACSDSEENNAVELVLQTGCDLELGYEGVALLELISHMAYNSAYHQLRTVEQLGYLVSAFCQKVTGGAWAFVIVVQSSVAEPVVLEERMEAWLQQFRIHLEEMDANDMAKEAGAVVAQLLERNTRLSQEVGQMWSEILLTEDLSGKLKEPAFDRLERIAKQLRVDDCDDGKSSTTTIARDDDDDSSRPLTALELKCKALAFFDTYLCKQSQHRRAMSSRVYSQECRPDNDKDGDYHKARRAGGSIVLSNHDDITHIKQYLSTWPTVPYWASEAAAATSKQPTQQAPLHSGSI